MIDGRIKFRHLQCFLAVVQHSSLQKAALALSLTQPAVSKTIKELEDLLKVRLFERGRRGTLMTQQAEAFSSYAEAAVSALSQAINFMGPTKNTIKPVIRIGATPGMGVVFVPRVLIAFNKLIPNVRVSLLTGTTGFLMEQLRESTFDLVLCRHLDPAKMVGLSFEYLYADPLVVVVRPGHPLLGSATSKRDGPRQFISILPPNSSINRRAATPLAMALNIHIAANFIESDSISFGRTYTMNSDAIWFVPWCAVQPDVTNGSLIRLSPPATHGDEFVGLIARSIGLMMQSNFLPSPELQILIGAIRSCATEYRQKVF